jgi:hypothetical protein
MRTAPWERLLKALEAAAASPTARAAEATPIAIGWATVELDRAVAELAAALDLQPAAFDPAPRSAVLGCACLVVRGVLSGGTSLAVLEPDTEGRLAGSLARLGEGPAAVWLQPASAAGEDTETPQRDGVADAAPGRVDAVLRAAGFAVAAERSGPFGLERLIADGAIQGPYRLLVRPPAGTIR